MSKINSKENRLKEKIEKLKKQNKNLKQEIFYLNELFSDVDESSEGLIIDALNGTFNGNDLGGKSDIKYARWLADRYGYKITKDQDDRFEVEKNNK